MGRVGPAAVDGRGGAVRVVRQLGCGWGFRSNRVQARIRVFVDGRNDPLVCGVGRHPVYPAGKLPAVKLAAAPRILDDGTLRVSVRRGLTLWADPILPGDEDGASHRRDVVRR